MALIIEEALRLAAPPLREVHDPSSERKLIHAVTVGLPLPVPYAIGTIEIGSAAGLLIAPIAGLAALAGGSVLFGAVLMEAFVLRDGNPITPAILLALLAFVAWQHRARTSTLLARVLPRRD